MLALSGCRTTEVRTEFVLPTLDAFEPERVPLDLIEQPLTAAEILHNSVQYEFLMYRWQDHADGLKDWIEKIRERLE